MQLLEALLVPFKQGLVLFRLGAESLRERGVFIGVSYETM
jgi:hypothetical protein